MNQGNALARNSGAGIGAAPRQPEIAREFDYQNASIGRLDKAVAALKERLQPVIASRPVTAPERVTPEDPSTSIGKLLRGNSDTITNIAILLEAITSDIEI